MTAERLLAKLEGVRRTGVDRWNDPVHGEPERALCDVLPYVR